MERKKKGLYLTNGKSAVSYTKEIISMLSDLKSIGKTREEIAEAIDCSRAYIDQIVTKGGNRIFASKLREYHRKLIVDPKNPLKYSKDEFAISTAAALHIIICRLAKLESEITKRSETAILRDIQLETIQYSSQLIAERV